MGPTGLHEPKAGAGDQGAVDDPDGADHTPVLIVVGVEEQALQRRVGVACGRRDAIADGVEQLRHAGAGLGGQAEDLIGRHPEHPFDLVGVAVRIGRGQVDLVEGGDDLLVVFEGLIGIRQGLGFDALGGVDQQHHALAGGQAAADLVPEVHVARRVDQVDGVVLPAHPYVLGLDGDAPLPLDVHRVQVLLAHVPGVDRAGQLQDAIGQGGLAVVDVGHDAQVPDAVEVQQGPSMGKDAAPRQTGPAYSYKCGAVPTSSRLPSVP